MRRCKDCKHTLYQHHPGSTRNSTICLACDGVCANVAASKPSRGCSFSNKEQYETEAKAKYVVWQIRKKVKGEGILLTVYKCPDGGHYHIGNSRIRKINPRGRILKQPFKPLKSRNRKRKQW